MREEKVNRRGETLAAIVREAAEPLPDIDDPAFGAMFDRFADARVVLLGEASHGTSEFYRARAAITRRLIERHGFRIVAAEADWPDAATIDRIVRRRPLRMESSAFFDRFPTWMWKNEDFLAFIGWLRDQLDRSAGDPRLGSNLFARKLALVLDVDRSPEQVLQAALDDIERVEAELAEVAASLGGAPREVLDRIAADAPTDDTVVAVAQEALLETTAFVEANDIITL